LCLLHKSTDDLRVAVPLSEVVASQRTN
jgi:hypothetical protein